MLDLIKPKLVYLDLPLFMALLSDLFPGVELPPAEGGHLRAAVETELREAGLQVCFKMLQPVISSTPAIFVCFSHRKSHAWCNHV